MAIPTERTLVILKPDAIARGLIGQILARIEQAGLAIVAAKLTQVSIDFARSHYPSHDRQLEQMGSKSLETYKALGIDPVDCLGTSDAIEIGKMIHEWNAEFLSSGPVMPCVVEGAHAIQKVRKLAGKTIPLYAEPGSIRGDFASTSPAIANIEKSSVFNLIHASDNDPDPSEPEKEIAYWFEDREIIAYHPLAMRAIFKSIV